MENEKLLIYFAHPKTHYNTELEDNCWDFIATCFDIYEHDSEIFNPNQLFIDKHMTRLKEEGDENYFQIFRDIVRSCDITVGTCFTDNVLGAGVKEEMETSLSFNKPTFLVTFHDLGDYIVKGMKQVTSLKQLKVIPFLTIEETRERINAGVL
jgi:hypothetical protein